MSKWWSTIYCNDYTLMNVMNITESFLNVCISLIWGCQLAPVRCTLYSPIYFYSFNKWTVDTPEYHGRNSCHSSEINKHKMQNPSCVELKWKLYKLTMLTCPLPPGDVQSGERRLSLLLFKLVLPRPVTNAVTNNVVMFPVYSKASCHQHHTLLLICAS